MKKLAILLAIFIGMINMLGAQTTYYVNVASGNDANSGTSWGNAFESFSTALSVAASGDQIWVSKGTYYIEKPYDSGDANYRDKAFILPENVEIYGGFFGNETSLSQRNWKLNPSILSGWAGTANRTDNYYHVVVAAGINGGRLDGFTISDGNANGTGSILVNGIAIERDKGGAIHCHTSPNLTFSNLVIRNNYAGILGNVTGFGGGAYFTQSTARLEYTILKDNEASYGGAIAVVDDTFIAVNTLVVENVGVYGGAIYLDISDIIMRNCTIAANRADSKGGGIYLAIQETLEAYNSIFAQNTAVSGGNDIRDDGLYSYNSVCCLITDPDMGSEQFAGLNIIVGNPQFTNSGEYFLKSVSPAVNKGDNFKIAGYSTDLNGSPRIADGIVDLGAYEVQCFAFPTAEFTQLETVICAQNIPPLQAIFYDSMGGSHIASTQYYESELATIAAAPSKAGYVFIEWNTQPDGSGVSYAPGTNFTMPGYDIFLYAIFTQPILHTIAYDTQGGSFVAPAQYYAGDLVMLPQAPTKAGYVFIEWNTTADGTGTSYSENESFIMPDYNITMYAIWASPQLYTVTYDSRGGSFKPPVDYYAGDLVAVSSAPTRPGYVFTGWNTQIDGSGSVYNPGGTFTMPDSNITLYAMYLEALKSLNRPTITIDVGGSGVPPYQVAYETFVNDISQGTSTWVGIGSNGVVEVPVYLTETTTYKLISITDGNGCVNSSFIGNNTTVVHIVKGVTGGNGIIYVNKSNPTSGDGSSWGNAFKELADALFYAEQCGNGTVNEVWVAQGTYTPLYKLAPTDFDSNPTTDRDATFFLPNNVMVYGGFTGFETSLNQRNWQAYTTTLSGDIGNQEDNADNCYHVVSAIGLTNAALDGFTIEGGNANGSSGVDVGGQSIGQETGGGVLQGDNENIKFKNLVVNMNEAVLGAGIFEKNNSSIFEKIVIKDNYATYGGGLFSQLSNSKYANMLIAKNYASLNGGGVYIDNSMGYLINSTVVDNQANVEGTGLYHGVASNFHVQNTIIWDNFYTGSTVSIAEAFPTIDFSIVQGYMGHDPMFTDPWSGNYHVHAFSRAVNGGESYFYYVNGLFGDSDLDGNPRLLGSRIDMGAYETECKLVTEAVFMQNTATICDGQPLTLDIEILDQGMGFEPPYFLTYTPDNGFTYIDTPPIWDRNTTITVNPAYSTTVRLEFIRDGRDCMQYLFRENTVDVNVLKLNPSSGKIYVDVNAHAGGDGSSWNSAVKELADALQFIRSCGNGLIEEIHVAGGIYYPLYKTVDLNGLGNATTSRDKSFVIPKNIKLYGSYRGGNISPNDRDTAIYRTVLSGDLLKNDLPGRRTVNKDDNAYHVVIAVAEDGYITIDGFTIVSGNASDFSDVKIENQDIQNSQGAGLYVVAAENANNITLSNNNIHGNQSYDMGGVYLSNIGHSSVVSFENSHLYNNSSQSNGGGIYVHAQANTTHISNCSVYNNSAPNGGGIYVASDAGLLVENCSIAHNKATTQGGGIYMYTSPQSDITIKGNHVNHNDAYEGGGLYVMTTSTTNHKYLNNCINNNTASNAGGMYLNTSSSVTATNVLLTNNSIVGNTSSIAQGLFIYAGSSPDVNITANNNIIWSEDTDPDSSLSVQDGSSNTLVFNNNLIEGNNQASLTQAPYDPAGVGNLDGTAVNTSATSDKVFASYAGSNYRLKANSIAVNKGNNSYTNAATVALDLDKLPRIVGGTVDMGAFEYLWGGLSLADEVVTYDGSEHVFSKPINGMAELAGYATAIVTNQAKGTDAGVYEHVLDIRMTKSPEVYPDIPLDAYLTILPGELTGITFNDATFNYDGTTKSIYVNNVPSGATVTYINNNKIDVGVYTVEAIVSKPNYRDTSLFATLTIEHILFTGLVFNDATFNYDGTTKSIYVQGVPSGATVDYIGNGQTEVGKYTIIATVSKQNYRDTALTAELTILPVGTDMYFGNWTTLYDGTAKSIYVQNLPSDNTGVTYTNNGQVNVGEYTVMAVVHRPSGDVTLTATLIIEPIMLTGMVLNDLTTVYDGNVKSLAVTYQRSGITIIYENNHQTEVGVYPVKATITKPNHHPLELEATLTILPATLTGMVLNDLTVVYDGTPKSILVTFQRSGITIDYQGNGQIEVGAYPVKAIVSKPNHLDLTLEATLTILPATLINIEFNDATFYYDGTPKSIYVSGEPSGTTVSYTGNEKINVGTYSVAAELSNRNYHSLTLTANLTIIYDLLEGLYIDGEEHDISQVYDTKCAERELRVNLVVKPGATVNIPISFTISLSKPGILQIPFTVTSDDGSRTKQFVLKIERRYPFDDIIDQKVNNVFMLDLKKLKEEGRSFDTYKWYKNGQHIHTGTYYSAGDSKTDLLDNTASYYAELISSDGLVLRTCEKIPVLTKLQMKAYPIPVKGGSVFTVQILADEAILQNSNLEIYNMMGVRVSSIKVAGVNTIVSAPTGAGVYIIRLVHAELSESIKIIVE